MSFPKRSRADEPERSRADCVAQWLDLTRRVLPAMAGPHRWPVWLDHCFMRICLDNALGCPWPDCVARPAIRHLTDTQLQAAIGMAQSIVDRPDLLPGLNRNSLRFRGKLA